MSWRKQELDKPLFEDLLWSRPEQKSAAGRLLIIGGNAHAIAAPSEAYELALKQEVGEAKVAMPDKTRKLLGPKLPLDIELVPSTPSGSFSTKAERELQSYMSWADATLMAGDIGRNSETAVLLESLAQKMPGPQIYTRDAADYFYSSPTALFEREHTLLVISLAQLQKFCQRLKHPKAVTFDMGLAKLVELLAELTSVNKCFIMTEYSANIIVAGGGDVISTKLGKDPDAWRLAAATAASVWWLQNTGRALEALATAITELDW